MRDVSENTLATLERIKESLDGFNYSITQGRSGIKWVWITWWPPFGCCEKYELIEEDDGTITMSDHHSGIPWFSHKTTRALVRYFNSQERSYKRLMEG